MLDATRTVLSISHTTISYAKVSPQSDSRNLCTLRSMSVSIWIFVPIVLYLLLMNRMLSIHLDIVRFLQHSDKSEVKPLCAGCCALEWWTNIDLDQA